VVKKTKKTLILMGFILGFVLLLSYTNIRTYINLEYIRDHQRTLQQFVDRHYGMAAFLYCSLYACFVFFMISLTLLLTVIAGSFFGTIPTTILSIVGALVGGTLSLLTVRYLLSTWLQTRYKHAVELFKEKFKKHGVSYLLSLQFFPLTPIALINIMAGLSDISLTTFLWTTVVGILPVTLLGAFAGKQLATMSSVKDILSPPIMLALAALSLFTLAPTIIDYFKK
jgi:uncharacterized membrane protein YdjX (TVP38/TMEM64 family)